ncbi:uncharacterized protein ACB058_019568 isoform 2-T2 [Synchiropus picturatus]
MYEAFSCPDGSCHGWNRRRGDKLGTHSLRHTLRWRPAIGDAAHTRPPRSARLSSSSTTNEACNANTQECTPPLDTCMTIVDTLGSATAIVKQCASLTTCRAAASSSSVDANGNGNSVNCCNSFNLCNFSGAEQLHGFSLLLVLTVALLLLLLLQH